VKSLDRSGLSRLERQHQAAYIKFARDVLAYAETRSPITVLDRAKWLACGEFGLFRLITPKAYGGNGFHLRQLALAMEGLGYGTRDLGFLFSLNAHLWTVLMPIITFGTEAQRRRYSHHLAAGICVGASAATELDAGSDIFSMKCSARREGDSYILNGRKVFVTNAPSADLFIIYATSNHSLGSSGISAYLVERDCAGLIVGSAVETIGLDGSVMAEICLENCRISLDQRLGSEGRGAEIFSYAMDLERALILTCPVGAMWRELEGAMHHARKRKQFGKTVDSFQCVSSRLVDMRIRLEISRLLIDHYIRLVDAHEPTGYLASMIKLYISESHIASSLDSLRTYGGYGYLRSGTAGVALQDSISGVLYSGTSDLQRVIIARGMGMRI
jgi:alkylation response protein AidB-like acyl-CoA dehydrogenase